MCIRDRHETVDVPASNMKKAVAQILLNEGFIKGVEVIEGEMCIRDRGISATFS